jgi:ribosomal protein S18 acetylase RimI-like enzyme
MKPAYVGPVSMLLTEGFLSKLMPGDRMEKSRVASVMGKLLQLDAEAGNMQRIVVTIEGNIAGSMAIQWQKPPAWQEKPRLLKLWQELRGIELGKMLELGVRLLLLSHMPAKHEGYIADVVVDPLYRGRGLGCYMLEWARCEAAKRPDIGYLSLHVSGANAGARRLYERFGFRASEVKRSALMGFLFGEREWLYMVCRNGEESDEEYDQEAGNGLP